ncbi:GlxA family transcriptional regulator, partial [Pseudomonas syringae]
MPRCRSEESVTMAQDFYFLLMPGISALGFIPALAPLRVAHRCGCGLYRCPGLRAAGAPVPASTGMR